MTEPDDKRLRDDADAFRAAMKGVKPLSTDKIAPPPQRPRPWDRPRNRPESVQDDPVSDPITDAPRENHTLGAFDRSLYARPGVQQRVIRRLNRGQLMISGELDLHGMTIREAKPSVLAFLQGMRGEEMCCVRIVHGKGLGSDNAKPVLKNQLDHWLRQLPEVLAFSSARRDDGGSGALNILLRRL